MFISTQLGTLEWLKGFCEVPCWKWGPFLDTFINARQSQRAIHGQKAQSFPFSIATAGRNKYDGQLCTLALAKYGKNPHILKCLSSIVVHIGEGKGQSRDMINDSASRGLQKAYCESGGSNHGNQASDYRWIFIEICSASIPSSAKEEVVLGHFGLSRTCGDQEAREEGISHTFRCN